MIIELQCGRFLRVSSGAGNSISYPIKKEVIMKRLILALSVATVALSGCAQLKDWYQDASAEAGATAAEEQSPFPSRFKNDHYYPL
jgi:hypothetical protein